MEFYNIDEQKSYTLRELKAKHPNVSFSKVISAVTLVKFGYAAVLETPKPTPTSNLYIIQRGGVELSDGNYIQKWKEIDRHADIPDGLTKVEQDTAYLAKLAADAQEQSDIEADRVNRQADNVLKFLKTKTAAEIDTYVTDNVTTLASAKTVIKGLAKAVGYLVKKDGE